MQSNLEELNRRSLSVVVPVFNNSDSLLELNLKLVETLRNMREIDYEVIYVDDGSTDDSLIKLQTIKKGYPESIRIVKLAGNFGQVNAILAGVENVRNELVATISADLQDPPELVQQMHSALGDKGRIVIAERLSRDDSFFMSLASRLTYSIMRIQNSQIPKGGFDCWMLDSRIASYVLNRSRISSLRQMNFFDAGNEVFRVKYRRKERLHGKSGYKLSKKLRMFIEIVVMSIGNLASYLVAIGFLIAIFSIFLFSLILYGYFYGKMPFQGFTFIVGLVTMMGSFLLIAVGAVLVLILRQGELRTGEANFVVESIT